MSDMINNVAIVGGTHGNELTGQYLVKHWQGSPDAVKRASFSTELMIANEAASAECRRYVEQDLNRQFATRDLNDESLVGLEQQRAKAINRILGPKGSPRTDLVIDLHTTTSNMGPTLLLPALGSFYSQLGAYVVDKMPTATVYWDEEHLANDEHHLLCTIGRFGVIVEVGPVPQGSLKQDVFEASAEMVGHILDFVEARNTDQMPTLPTTYESFRFLHSIHLPCDDQNERIGMVHSDRQDKDFMPIHPGDPIFKTFGGEVISYQGDDVVYGVFINEAAYYDNNLAMSIAEKWVVETYQ